MQVEHKTENGTVRFELLPEEVSKVKLYNYSRAGIWYGDAEPKGLNAWKKQLPKGFQLIGLTSEVTEDQARDMFGGLSTGQLDGVWYSIDNGKNYSYETALSALKHIMQHKKVYEVNPYPKYYIDKITGNKMIRIDWQQAQEKTGKWVVLFKPNEK